MLQENENHKDNARPFPIQEALQRIEIAIAKFKKAALFELAEDGYASIFQQVVACMISVRTRDEDTIPMARALFAKASSPERMLQLSVDEITELIPRSTFARTKAKNILAIAKIAVVDHQGELPCKEDALLSLPGIGPKCANLAMGIACGEAKIGVDIHVHRVTNRWGYVATKTPEQTLAVLEARLPKTYWVELNRLLVPFGKHICTGNLPHCDSCPLNAICPQIGVTRHR